MKAERHELDLLHLEGYEYYIGCPRGWHYKGKWIGYNVQDAFDHRAKRESGELPDQVGRA